jgi:cytokinin dehydrogenase
VSSQHMQRREFLKTAGVAAIIVGYSTTKNAWVTEAHAHGNDAWTKVPALDGQLLTDATTREHFGDDLGLIITTSPKAVLRPASVDDIVKMVKFCRKYGIEIAARGQGHATHGQAQVNAGVVIDMSAMQQIHEIGDGFAVVDGGCTWRILLHQSLPAQTPPVLTGYIGLSIGGTLSMGGISGMAYNIGVQIQHALELTIVTGKGNLVTCSETQKSDLFNAALAGQGQCGIIVKAKVKLVPAKAMAANTTAVYFDVAVLKEDMRTLVNRNELDSVYALGGIDPGSGQVVWQINVAKFHDGAAPDMAFYMRDLNFIPPTLATNDLPYEDYQLLVDNQIDMLRSFGMFEGVMHPWYDVFVGDSQVVGHVTEVLTGLQPDDVGMFGFILLFPLKRSTITRPLFRLPNEELVWLFDVLTSANAPGKDPDFAANKRARNNVWYDMARDVGGTRYPIGTLDFDHGEWRRHYGGAWADFKDAKEKYDPDHILTPGPGIFRKGRGC